MGTIRDIQDAICAEFGITRDQLVGPSHKSEFVIPHHIAMRRARETGASFYKIGRAFRRDHTTVLAACRKVTRDPA